jgi:hypothetical protein
MASQVPDPDMFTSPFQLTKGMHRDVYPAVDPSSPALSAKGKVVVITGASGGIGYVRLGRPWHQHQHHHHHLPLLLLKEISPTGSLTFPLHRYLGLGFQCLSLQTLVASIPTIIIHPPPYSLCSPLLPPPPLLYTPTNKPLPQAVAKSWATAGATGIVLAGRTPSALEVVAAEIGPSALVVEADVGVEAEAKNLIDRAVAAFGRVDVLVTTAAHASMGPATGEIEPGTWWKDFVSGFRYCFYF